MNTTTEKLHQLKLPAFIEVLEEVHQNPTHTLSLNEALAMMVDRELLFRENKRLARLLKMAKLRYPSASIAHIDYHEARKTHAALLRALTHCQWITQPKNILFTGPTGTGKSYLACAFGHQACQKGYRTRYLRLPRLMEQLRLSHADGSYTKLLEHLAKVPLLILDDWGIDQLDRQARRDLLEVLEDRYAKTATIITSQLPTDQWHHFIGDDTIADAICDRVLHCAYKIQLKGGSMRQQIT